MVALAVVAGLVWVSGGLERISLSTVAAQRTSLDAFVARSPVVAAGLYMLAFGLLTGACLPVALTLTLAGGVVLGPWLGGGATVAGATLGATLTYAAARSTLGERMGTLSRRVPRLEALVGRARVHPFQVMLFARLMPLFPFAAVNVAAGLARIPLRPYVVATFLGAIPSSLIYCSLGAGLDRHLLQSEASVASALASPILLWPLGGLVVLTLASLALRPLARGLRAPR